MADSTDVQDVVFKSVESAEGRMVFVMAGPDAAIITPGLRFTYPQAEAMKPADSSCRYPPVYKSKKDRLCRLALVRGAGKFESFTASPMETNSKLA